MLQVPPFPNPSLPLAAFCSLQAISDVISQRWSNSTRLSYHHHDRHRRRQRQRFRSSWCGANQLRACDIVALVLANFVSAARPAPPSPPLLTFLSTPSQLNCNFRLAFSLPASAQASLSFTSSCPSLSFCLSLYTSGYGYFTVSYRLRGYQ